MGKFYHLLISVPRQELNYFWNKYCDSLLPAIDHSQFPFWYFCIILISKSENYAAKKLATKNKILWTKRPIEEKLFIILEGFIKQLVIKQRPTFSHWLLYGFFFLFPFKAFIKLEKLIRFHRQAFIICKKG